MPISPCSQNPWKASNTVWVVYYTYLLIYPDLELLLTRSESLIIQTLGQRKLDVIRINITHLIGGNRKRS